MFVPLFLLFLQLEVKTRKQVNTKMLNENTSYSVLQKLYKDTRANLNVDTNASSGGQILFC